MREYDCPVCGSRRKDSLVCEQCGWDFTTDGMIYGMLSDPEKELRKKQLMIMRRNYKELIKLKKEEKEWNSKKESENKKARMGDTFKIPWKKEESREILSETETRLIRSFTGTIEIEEGYRVIGDHAFENSKMKKIRFPSSLEKIGKMAFYCCENLKEIEIPSVKEISVESFMACRNLEQVILPEGLEYLGISAFACCENLKEIRLPSTLKKMEYSVFHQCAKLKTIYLASGISQEIEEQLKYMRISAKTEKTGEEKKAELDEGGKEKIQKKETDTIFDPILYQPDKEKDRVFIEIPQGYQRIKGRAFEEWTLLERIWMPDSVKEIGANAFYGCSHLTQIRWSQNLEKIETGAFCGCSSLKRICLPEGVTEIGNAAFLKCTHLESIKLPSSLKKIGTNVFQGCCNLNKIEMERGISPQIRKALEEII